MRATKAADHEAEARRKIDRLRVQAQAEAEFCRNPVHRNKTVRDGAGNGWFARGAEVKPKQKKWTGKSTFTGRKPD